MDIPILKSKLKPINHLSRSISISNHNNNRNTINSTTDSYYSPNTRHFTAHSSTDLERHFPAEILAPTSLKLSQNDITNMNGYEFNQDVNSDSDSDSDTDAQFNKKLIRTYSENETGNFHLTTGERLYDDERYRPNHSQTFYQNESCDKLTISKTHIPTSEEYNLTGVEDEYIPGLDFANVVAQWVSSETNSNYSSHFNSPTTSYLDLRQLHSQVEPKPIISQKNTKTTTSTDSEYERIFNNLPNNFTNLPFSQRRKIIKSISPSIDYSQFSLFAKRKLNPSSQPTYASHLINSLSRSPTRQQHIDDKGSVILNHELGNVIGFGAWGIIRECVGNGTIRAMKIVRTKNTSVSRHFKKEIAIWKLLHHKHILPLIDVLETEYAIFCVTNRVYGGTLFDMVQSWGMYNTPQRKITRAQRIANAKLYGLQILSGVQYMHGLGIVHGDIKLENCLINENSNEVIICDFGMAQYYTKDSAKLQRRPSIVRSQSSNSKLGISNIRQHHGPAPQSITLSSPRDTFTPYQSIIPKFLNSDCLPHSHIGSLPYASPELILPSPPPLGPTADIWAMGVLLYTMVVGKLPFQHSYEPRLRAMISAGKYDLESLVLACGENGVMGVVGGCLEVDIVRRMDLDMVIEMLGCV